MANLNVSKNLDENGKKKKKILNRIKNKKSIIYISQLSIGNIRLLFTMSTEVRNPNNIIVSTVPLHSQTT
jgi:hypothetical protein